MKATQKQFKEAYDKRRDTTSRLIRELKASGKLSGRKANRLKREARV